MLRKGQANAWRTAWRLAWPPAFVLSSPGPHGAAYQAYMVQRMPGWPGWPANAWRMARSVPSHSLRLCWIISWYVTLRTPRLVAKQRRRSGAMGRNIPRSFSPGATPKPDHPFKTRAYLCSGVFHRRGPWSLAKPKLLSKLRDFNEHRPLTVMVVTVAMAVTIP